MARTWVFGDLISNLFERKAQFRGTDDTRSITALCDALLSAEGEVSGIKIASNVLQRYAQLDPDGKRSFFNYLNDHLDVDADQIAALAKSYANEPSIDTFKAMGHAAEPRRQELLRRLNQPVGATDAIVAMRLDLLNAIKTQPELARTDHDFIHLFRSWFNRGFLVLKQIDWDTPARMLDKIVVYEAVHRIDNFESLRRRLGPPDRKCFAFFHPSLPDEPLIFVEVALTDGVPTSIDALLREDRTPIDPAHATTAVFYSISNCQAGLAGISFGNLLIKQVVAELSLVLPNLDTFVTLSPIPHLNRWLTGLRDDPVLSEASEACLTGTAPRDLQQAMAARYLLQAKREDGQPLDPVARFHLGNGAQIHDVHAQADLSENGLKQSGGVMVNYLYDLRATERNHGAFVTAGTVAASRKLQALATADIDFKTKEPIA